VTTERDGETAPGVFTISLDTELAWGSFDKDDVERYRAAYRQTPAIVERLCTLFAEYNVSATWAVVAHLVADCDDHDSTANIGCEQNDPDRTKWLESAPCSTGIDRSLWYAPEILETIQSCPTPQEVGLHGYSHLVFGDYSRAVAEAELNDAMAVARERGLEPTSFVYPRNEIAHVDILAEHGLDIYRGVDARWYERRPLGFGRKPLRFFDEAVARTPRAVRPVKRGRIICLPGSQVFRPERGAWAWTPEESQSARACKGLDRAATTGNVYHLWFHPFNLAGDIDHHFDVLKDILTYADTLRLNDELTIMSMADVANAYRDGQWHEPAVEGII
jgi:peptidoglycan/xylan/chitin deacetylase (PgdA/CDA1 family)